MKYMDRHGNKRLIETKQEILLRRFSSKAWGRRILKSFKCPIFSKMGYLILKTRLSTVAIPLCINANKIDMTQYEDRKYKSYQEFFIRKIKHGYRRIEANPNVFVSPSDGKVSVYKIDENSHFFINNDRYTTIQLIQDRNLAKKYKNGFAIVIRLTVDDYHRYCYPTDGVKSNNRKINGKNKSFGEYTLIRTKEFGDIIQMEMGNSINYHEKRCVKKGIEKGRFEFGKSTIILFLEKDSLKISKDLFENTKNGFETIVKMGEEIGRSKHY